MSETDQDLGRMVDSLSREMKNLRELVLAYNPRIRELEDRVDAAERQLSALGTRMDSAEARPDPLEDRLDAIERTDDALGARVALLEAKGQADVAWTEEVRRALDANGDALNGVRADLDDLRKRLSAT